MNPEEKIKPLLSNAAERVEQIECRLQELWKAKQTPLTALAIMKAELQSIHDEATALCVLTSCVLRFAQLEALERISRWTLHVLTGIEHAVSISYEREPSTSEASLPSQNNSSVSLAIAGHQTPGQLTASPSRCKGAKLSREQSGAF